MRKIPDFVKLPNIPKAISLKEIGRPLCRLSAERTQALRAAVRATRPAAPDALAGRVRSFRNALAVCKSPAAMRTAAEPPVVTGFPDDDETVCEWGIWETPTGSWGGLGGLDPSVRLMDGFYPVRDQSKRGACFAFAMTALCEYMLQNRKIPLSEQSLFVFTKLATPGLVDDVCDGSVDVDTLRAVEQFGICPQELWHYNPESWNWIEDPNGEGSGTALERILHEARPYRFGPWRQITSGSVLQLKQAIHQRFPVYVGVFVFPFWGEEKVFETGIVPCPGDFTVLIRPPSAAAVNEWISRQEDAGNLDPEDVIRDIMMEDLMTIVAPFGSGIAVIGCDFTDEGLVVRFLSHSIEGGHALCLAGYADDERFPGGGYFIARNSWGESWAPDSPEKAGYAILPYAYIEKYCLDGWYLPEWPEPARVASRPLVRFPESRVAAAAASHASPAQVSQAAAPAHPASPFDEWLVSHTMVLDRPARDANGRLLRVGSRVFVPDPSNPAAFLPDTPENRIALESDFKRKRLFGLGREAPCTAAFAAGRSFGDSFLAAERGTFPSANSLPFPVAGMEKTKILAIEETADLSEAWALETLRGLPLPEGTEVPAEWFAAAAGASRATLFRVRPERAGGTSVWLAAASLQSFGFGSDASQIVPIATSAGDVNALHRCAEAAMPDDLRGKPHDIYYLVASPGGWSEETKARLFRSGLPVLLAAPGGDGSWLIDLPPDGRLPAAKAALLEKLVPVAEEEISSVVRETVDGLFSAGIQSASVEMVRNEVLSARPSWTFLGLRRIRSTLLSLQAAESDRYAFCANKLGGEEVRQPSALGSCRRVTV